MTSAIADHRRMRSHRLVLPPEAAVLEPLETVGWTSARWGYSSKTFEITSLTDSLMSMLQGLSLRERRSQAIALLALLGTLDRPTVALGDFNDWFWAGSVRRTLARVLPGFSRHRTFPARWPLFQLDGVYLSSKQALLGSHTDPEARAISDHLPVVADIAMA